MDLLELHGQASAHFDSLVQRIGPDQWSDPTPDTEWSVRDLVNHLVYEQLWVPPLLAGSTVEEVGDKYDGDVLGADPVASWTTAAAAARAAWTAPGAIDRTVALSYGPRPATGYLREMTMDLAVHAWDLARGIGADDTLPEPLVAEALDYTRETAPMLAASGLFAAPLPVSDDADDQTRLLAMLGRRR